MAPNPADPTTTIQCATWLTTLAGDMYTRGFRADAISAAQRACSHRRMTWCDPMPAGMVADVMIEVEKLLPARDRASDLFVLDMVAAVAHLQQINRREHAREFPQFYARQFGRASLDVAFQMFEDQRARATRAALQQDRNR